MEQNTGYFALSILQIVLSILLSLFYSLVNVVLYFMPPAWKRHDVTDKVILITGAGSGIGQGVAQRLAKKKAKIVSWDINSSGNDDTAKLIRDDGGKCFTYTVDLCDRNAIYKAAQRVKKEVGKVDILVNNAGIVTGRHFLEAPDELILKTFDVNVLSHFWTTKAFLPDMMTANSGQVVTIASLAGIFGSNKLVDYCSSKFAAVGFDESLTTELFVGGYKGISTTVVCPFYINTGMFEGVQSRIIPILEQDYVADEICDAILMKKRILILPKFFGLIVFMKGLLSCKAYQYFAMSLGMTYTMDDFVGRNKQKAS